MSLALVTVTGKFLAADLTPLAGTVTFTPSVAVTDTTDGQFLYPTPVKVTLDGTGAFTTALVSSNNALVNPQGFTYGVVINITTAGASSVTRYDVVVPISGPVDLSTLAPVPATSGSLSYASPTNVPAGGAAGTALTKKSATNYDTQWTDLTSPSLAARDKVRRIVGSTVQTALQAGHTWNVTGTPVNLALNNTTDFILGSQSVTFDTNGAGAYTVPQGPSPESVAINSTGKAFRVWVKVSDPTQVGEFTFWAGSGGSFANTYFWDLLLYTGSAPNYLIAGQWSPLTFHIGTANVTGTPDRTALNRLKFQIKDRSGGAISVGLNGFELIPDSSAIYPNGVVTISFDDSYASQFTSARAVMDKYGYAGTAYVITGNIGTGGRLSLAQATTLQDDHGWEIATHGATQAAHDAGWQTLTTAARVAEAQAAKSWLLQNGFRAADHFAYPGGHYESGVYADVKPYFASARTIMSQNAETWPPADPLRVRSMQPSASTSLASVQTQVDFTFNGKGWLPLSFHDFVTSGPTGVQWTQANFDSLCAYILAKGMPVRTVGQVLRGE